MVLKKEIHLRKKKKISDNNQKNKKKTDADNKTRKELEAIRLENRTKLLKKLEEILNNIPYDKKLVNCQVNKCECCVCNKCNIGVNDIKDEKEEKEWCKDGVFKNCRCEKCICIGGNEIPSFLSRINKKICPCIDDNSNIKLRSTMFGKEIYCPIKYKYTSNIKNLIESEINKSEYNKIFDNNKISKENIRILLKKPIDEAAKQNFINSEKKEELIEYIITKLKNNMGSIYV